MKRNIFLLINPPNSQDLLKQKESIVTKGVQHTDWANLPCLGILSLATYISHHSTFECIYLDGVVCPWDFIKQYILQNKKKILAIGISTLTASYGSAKELFAYIKQIEAPITTIIGNDHFSAMPREILSNNAHIIDYGFIGNDVHRSLNAFLTDLSANHLAYENYPGLVYKNKEEITFVPPAAEPLNTVVDYSLIDKTYPHSKYYNQNFQNRLKNRLFEKFGRNVLSGIPIEIARGCIKFAKNDPCSFCSIQHNALWRNANTAKDAWKQLETAYQHNYGYFYITADELPLTFRQLLKQMHENIPAWWKNIPKEKKPIMMGYARADGLTHETSRLLKELGFKIIMIGLDAGTPLSLIAMNKILHSKLDKVQAGHNLFQRNCEALQLAEQYDFYVKAGFVIGHLGMDKELLQKNVDSICHLLKQGKKSILSVDIEVLSPEPGSKDYQFLLSPSLALETAHQLNLTIAPANVLLQISKKYQNVDYFDREEAMADYIASVMPQLSFNELAKARDNVRLYAKSLGLLVGED